MNIRDLIEALQSFDPESVLNARCCVTSGNAHQVLSVSERAGYVVLDIEDYDDVWLDGEEDDEEG